jgi:hypothetical protein
MSPCESDTTIFSAPASFVPAIAAFVSSVIARRAHS